MKNKFFLAWLQLLLVFFITVPPQLVHELHQCKDTDDHFSDEAGVAISTIHHHCEVLQLETPPLKEALIEYKFSGRTGIFYHFIDPVSIYKINTFSGGFQRGPPVI